MDPVVARRKRVLRVLARCEALPAAAVGRVNVRDPVPCAHHIVKRLEPWAVVDTHPAVI